MAPELNIPAHSKLTFASDPDQAYALTSISDLSPESKEIDRGVSEAKAAGLVSNGIAGALPTSGPAQKKCLRGTITYSVQNHSPGYNFKSPQSFTFITQGQGYVRTSGNGANGVLSRKYQ